MIAAVALLTTGFLSAADPSAIPARDGWSEPVGCLQVQLVFGDGRVVNGTRLPEVYLELNKLLIVPPEGTDKTDVDLVFGKPKEIRELEGKGSSADYPMHIYELLPPVGKEEFHAFLYVTYRQGKVWRAGINHLCVVKNRYAGVIEDSKQKQEIEQENQKVLVDLRDIRNRFAGKLKAASWNKTASAQDARLQPPSSQTEK